MTLSALAMTGCGGGTEETADGGAASGEQVIIYSNADDEAVEAMKATLDANGYANQYMFHQSDHAQYSWAQGFFETRIKIRRYSYGEDCANTRG